MITRPVLDIPLALFSLMFEVNGSSMPFTTFMIISLVVLGMENKKRIMVLDFQDNGSKFCLRVSPRLLCGSPRSHYCIYYAELRGEDAEIRGGNSYKLFIFHSQMAELFQTTIPNINLH